MSRRTLMERYPLDQSVAWNLKIGRLADLGFGVIIAKSDKNEGLYVVSLWSIDSPMVARWVMIDAIECKQVYAGISYLYEKHDPREKQNEKSQVG